MRIFYIVIFLFFGCLYATNQELFLQGNKEYEQHSYQKALDTYHTIENKGASVWYNMGLCCYNMGEYAQALVYWHKAEQASNSRDMLDKIARNKKDTQERLQLYVPHSYSQCIRDTIIYYTSCSSFIWWQLLFLMVWYMHIFYMRTFWRKRRWFLILFLWVITIALAIIMSVYYIDSHKHQAIVIKPSTALMIGPDNNFASKDIVPMGQQVEVQQKQDGWIKIIYASKRGWVPAESLALV